MFTISNQNKINSQTFSNMVIDSFTVTLFPQSNVGGFAGAVHDTTALNFKGTLYRHTKEGAQPIELFNTTLKNLVTLTHIKTAAFEYIQSPGAVFTQAVSAGPVVNGIVPLRFDLGGILDLDGDDKLVVEWILNDGFWGASVDQANSSIEVDECRAIGEEYFTPKTNVIVIQASEQNPSYSLGDNVMNLVIANYDKATALSNVAVINSLSLNSRQLVKNDSYREIVNKNLNYYSNSTEAAVRIQNFIIFQGENELDALSLNLNLNTSQVAASKNFILYGSFMTSDWLVTRAEQKYKARMAAAEKKGSYNSSLVTSNK